MRSDKIPCNGCGELVRRDTDWLYLFEAKVYTCEPCAQSRFDYLYDSVPFDWWEEELKLQTERRKREIIARLGSLSPSAMDEIRQRASRSQGARRG